MKRLLVVFWFGVLTGMAVTVYVQDRYSLRLVISDSATHQPLIDADGDGTLGTPPAGAGVRPGRKASRKSVSMPRLDPALFPPGLSVEARTLVLDLVALAEDGRLWGCDCCERDRPMPCPHVLEAADDPALPLILEIESSSRGSGPHVLAAVGEVLSSDPVRYPDYAPSHRPIVATDSEPGSAEKCAVLRERIRSGESVSRPGDVVHRPLGRRGQRICHLAMPSHTVEDRDA